MEDSSNYDIAQDGESVAAILNSIITELKCDCSDCDVSSVVSMKEGCGSPLSSWDAELEAVILSITSPHVMPEESLLDVDHEGNCGDLEEENQFVGVENIDDDFLWEMDNRSYEDLLKKFIEKEEELRVSNFKLQLSEQEIVGLRVQVENSESRINDMHEKLELKDDELYEQKELSYIEIFKLVTQIKKSESQLDNVHGELNMKNSQLDNMRGELNLKSSQLDNVRGELNLKNNQLDNMRGDLNIKNSQLDNMRGELNLKNSQLDNVCKELELKTGQFDNVYQELKLKVEELNEQMELSNEEVFKLKTHIKDLRKEIDSKLPKTHEFQFQIKEEKENMAILKCELETLIRTNEDNDINRLKELRKLISTMFDLHVKSFWMKEELRTNITSLSKQKEQLTSKLEYYESRNKELEQGYEAEKLKQKKLHSTQLMNLQDEINYLRKKLGERMNDVELNRTV